jgi:hypothetical protein
VETVDNIKKNTRKAGYGLNRLITGSNGGLFVRVPKCKEFSVS